MTSDDPLFSSGTFPPSPYKRKYKLLIQLLFGSLTLNAAFAATFIYLSFFYKTEAQLDYDLKPANAEQQQAPLAEMHHNREVLLVFKEMAFEQLIAKLGDTQLVEDGYTKRDLALSALVHFYYFDLKKALSGAPLQQRVLSIASSFPELTIYPGLTDEQFQAIIHYAKTERWPFVSKGLFQLLKQTSSLENSTLAETFFLTQEFLAVKMLFHHIPSPPADVTLLKMLLEGNWDLLQSFFQAQRTLQDLSDARRQKFLLDYIQTGSKTAAYLLLHYESTFAAKRLDDQQVLILLNLLTEKTTEGETFAKELLLSLRSDVVLQHATEKLYAFAGEPMPASYDYVQALARFIPEEVLIQKANKVSLPVSLASSSQEKSPSLAPILGQSRVNKDNKRKEHVHVVQKGDNLWRIARKYQSDVKTIKRYNRLQDENLQTGQVLKIPASS